MASNDPVVDKLEMKVTDLERDMAKVGTLVDRLDVTIEKLTEVASNVSQLLAVQGNRLETQERVAERFQELLEKRRHEQDAAIKDVYGRIERIETDIYKDIEDNHKSILDELKTIKNDGLQQHKEMNDRIGRFERWMWTCMGGGGIILVILNSLDFANIMQH